MSGNRPPATAPVAGSVPSAAPARPAPAPMTRAARTRVAVFVLVLVLAAGAAWGAGRLLVLNLDPATRQGDQHHDMHHSLAELPR
ncbi:MAG TPA: hypothetical protein VEZ42_18670 [Pseudonocardia sp.]|nr:hypothetical protein [Pseudonocardia sp.]